jgi:hypothetical protein
LPAGPAFPYKAAVLAVSAPLGSAEDQPAAPPDAPLMRPLDWLLCAGVMALGLAGRLQFASGMGLGDDFIFRGEVATILFNHQVLPDNQAYRFVWWLPTALSCRIFGLTEFGLILPFVVASVLGIGAVYALGLALYGRAGAVIASLLVAVTPIDFVWSTMMTPDIMLSVMHAFTILFVVRALQLRDPLRRRRAWFFAAISLWLSFHAKIPGVLVAPAIALAMLANWRRLDRQVWTFFTTAAVLYCATFLTAYVFWGDPFIALTHELKFQGLSGPQAVARRVYPGVFWYYPNLLFLNDHLGDLLYSVHPHLLILLALVAPFLGLRTSWIVFWWLLFVFLGMQGNFQRVDGVWITGFRNIRHIHCLLFPTVLLLTGYLVSLRIRHPRLVDVGVAALLLFTLRESVNAAWAPRSAFAARREVCNWIEANLAKGTRIYSEQGLQMWCSILDELNGAPRLTVLSPSADGRRSQINTIQGAYIVTGGANDPIYGCPPCIPKAAELVPTRWRLVKEFAAPDPATDWYFEPFRVWEALPPPPPPLAP